VSSAGLREKIVRREKIVVRGAAGEGCEAGGDGDGARGGQAAALEGEAWVWVFFSHSTWDGARFL
jgi:hypothetical protein